MRARGSTLKGGRDMADKDVERLALRLPNRSVEDITRKEEHMCSYYLGLFLRTK